MRFEPMREHHMKGAAALAHQAYRRECRHVSALRADDIPTVLRSAMTELARHGRGIVAIDGDRLLGYMAFVGPIHNFFGDGIGCFSPLHGSSVSGDDRTRLASLLFEHAAGPMTLEGVNTFAITTYRHDPEVAEALALNGFGIRCTDAIRMIDPPLDTTQVPGITYREVLWQEAGTLLPLLNGLVRHLRQSPTFVAAGEFTSESFGTLRERRQSRFFVAFDDETPIGYLEVTEDGENVLTTVPDMRNICGAYLAADYRGRGIYQNILQVALSTLRKEGVRRVGVDFETMNPTALGFWTKYFERYTTSFARRIDELG